jgi:hypothetical protein
MAYIPTMIEIDNTVVSLDIVEKKFICDISRCRGYCCVHGASGAPLENGEAERLKKVYPDIKPFLRREGIRAIDKQGTSVIDVDDEVVTPLVDGKECAYAIFENGNARCGIERAYEQGATDFNKPLSCHLYPVRIRKYHSFEAVNYDRWHICDPARELGQKMNITVFDFTKKALLRKYGQEYCAKLETARKEFTHPDEDIP